jgi:hypothetical protein
VTAATARPDDRGPEGDDGAAATWGFDHLAACVEECTNGVWRVLTGLDEGNAVDAEVRRQGPFPRSLLAPCLLSPRPLCFPASSARRVGRPRGALAWTPLAAAPAGRGRRAAGGPERGARARAGGSGQAAAAPPPRSAAAWGSEEAGGAAGGEGEASAAATAELAALEAALQPGSRPPPPTALRVRRRRRRRRPRRRRRRRRSTAPAPARPTCLVVGLGSLEGGDVVVGTAAKARALRLWAAPKAHTRVSHAACVRLAAAAAVAAAGCPASS